jgi:hypothetical protein
MSVRSWLLSLASMKRLLAFAFVLAAHQACSSTPAAPVRVCTPGNNVFCRCIDRSEGTKLCNDQGTGYSTACRLGESLPCPGGEAPEVDSGTGEPSCGPNNCTGCCLNGACQPGLTTAGCGKGGEACTVCTGRQICKADQRCGVDPESSWVLHPATAIIAAKNGAGGDWDVGGGAPDPYVHLWCPATATTPVVTPTVNDTLTPTWATGSCTMKAKDLLTAGFALQVFDEDISFADPVSTKQTIVATESQLQAGKVEIAAPPLTFLRVELTQQ